MNKLELIDRVASSQDNAEKALRKFFDEDARLKDRADVYQPKASPGNRVGDGQFLFVDDAICLDPLTYLLAHAIEAAWKDACIAAKLDWRKVAPDQDLAALAGEYRDRLRYISSQIGSASLAVAKAEETASA